MDKIYFFLLSFLAVSVFNHYVVAPPACTWYFLFSCLDRQFKKNLTDTTYILRIHAFMQVPFSSLLRVELFFHFVILKVLCAQ